MHFMAPRLEAAAEPEPTRIACARGAAHAGCILTSFAFILFPLADFEIGGACLLK
jgi:hypothetical protein